MTQSQAPQQNRENKYLFPFGIVTRVLDKKANGKKQKKEKEVADVANQRQALSKAPRRTHIRT
jgi:hypothetical protein